MVRQSDGLPERLLGEMRSVVDDSDLSHPVNQFAAQRRQAFARARAAGVARRLPGQPDHPHAALEPPRQVIRIADRIRTLHEYHQSEDSVVREPLEVIAQRRSVTDDADLTLALPLLVDLEHLERGTFGLLVVSYGVGWRTIRGSGRSSHDLLGVAYSVAKTMPTSAADSDGRLVIATPGRSAGSRPRISPTVSRRSRPLKNAFQARSRWASTITLTVSLPARSEA